MPDINLPKWPRNSPRDGLREEGDLRIMIPIMILMIGMIGEKLTDFFAEVIMIANGLTTT